MDKMHEYRQPMVTATGIFLGFMLNFTSVWIKDAFTKQPLFRDIVFAVSITVCLFVLLLVLFRMLRMNYPVEPQTFYRNTLRLFLLGIILPFLGFLIVLIEKLLIRLSG